MYPSRPFDARPSGRALLPARLAARGVPFLHRTYMSITQDQVVSIHYTLKDDAGEILDSSPDGEPLVYLHGHGNLYRVWSVSSRASAPGTSCR